MKRLIILIVIFVLNSVHVMACTSMPVDGSVVELQDANGFPISEHTENIKFRTGLCYKNLGCVAGTCAKKSVVCGFQLVLDDSSALKKFVSRYADEGELQVLNGGSEVTTPLCATI